MTIKDAMSIINNLQQKGVVIEVENHDQVEEGEWSIQDDKAVPYTYRNGEHDPSNRIKSPVKVRYTFTSYIWLNWNDYANGDYVNDLNASFDSLAELYIWLAKEIPKYFKN